METTLKASQKTKQTSVGEIPVDWGVTALRDLIDIKHGYAFQGEYFSSSGHFLILTPGNFYEEGGFRLRGELDRYYSGEFPEEYILNAGDMLVAMTEQKEGLLGSPAIIPEDNKYLHNQRLGVVRIKDRERLSKLFLFHVLNLNAVRRQIAATAGGTKVRHTSPDKIRGVPVPVPPRPEQDCIAKILSTWDHAIEKAEKLIKAKKKLKKGLMQQLLTGKRRFPMFGKNGAKVSNDWKTYQLGELFDRVTRKNSAGCSNILTISGPLGLVNQADYFNKRVAARDVSGYYLLRQGEFAYNKSYCSGYPLGAIKRLNLYPEGVVSTLYICFCLQRDAVSGDFMELYFESGIFNRELYGIAHEGARSHGLLNVSPDDFFDTQITLPGREEQESIVGVLGTASREIAMLERELSELRSEKKGLMQQLLTGKVRVRGAHK